MALSNVALTDTFDVWRTRTNQIIIVTNDVAENDFNKISGNTRFRNITMNPDERTEVVNVSNGYISANGAGLRYLKNTSIVGVITNSQLQNNKITLISNTSAITVSGGVADIGKTVYIDAKIVDRVNDTSTTNIAAASAVKTTYDYATSIGVSDNAFATAIGTSGNAYAVVVGASANARANVVGTSGNAYTLAAFTQANTALSTAQAALVNSSATFAGTLTFAQSGTNTAPVIARGGAGNTSTGLFFPATRNTVALVANSQYGVYVSPTGNVSIGSANASYKLHVLGDIYATGDITAFSDAALKTDVVTISDAVSLVKNLRGVRYTRTDNQQRKVGVIAQEVREVLPEVVVNSDNQIGVSYQSMVAVLIEAVKELSAEVEKLKGK